MSADTSSVAENEPIAPSAIPKWHPAKSPDGQFYSRRFLLREETHSACQMYVGTYYGDAKMAFVAAVLRAPILISTTNRVPLSVDFSPS